MGAAAMIVIPQPVRIERAARDACAWCPVDDERQAIGRGIRNGLILSIPLWAVLLLAWWLA